MGPASAITIPQASGVVLASSGSKLMGFSIYCTTASQCNLREGGASGKILAVIKIPATTAMGDQFGAGVVCNGDLYIQWTTAGTDAIGSIWVA